jgi:O-antigen ligase
VLLVVASPWPYGSADPHVARAISLLALAAALAALVLERDAKVAARGPFEAWPLAALFLLALAQMVPLPRAVLAAVAPGPAALWHPAVAAAATVLGDGARPVSIAPEATRRLLSFAAGVLALALLGVPALRARRTALAAAVAVTGGALLVALYGVVARTLFGPLLFGRIPVPTVAPFGSFVSKNHFAGYVEMATLLAAGLAWGLADEARRSPAALSWVGSSRAGRVVVAAGASLAMGLATLLSQSRGGALSLAAGALALVALRAFVGRRRAPWPKLAMVAAALALLAAGAVFVLPPEARGRLATLAGMEHDNSGQFRIIAWRDTLRLAARSPLLGHGLGAYADALPPVKSGLGYVVLEHAESDALEMLAEGGLLGLLLVVAAVALFARAVAGGLARQTDRLRRGLGLGAAAGVFALLVHSLFDFNLRIPSNALLFALLAALALAAGDEPAGVSAPTRPSSRGHWAALATAVALVLAVVTPAGPTRALPDEVQAFAVKGGRPVTALRVALATEALSAHLRRRPADASGWLFLAWLRSAQGRAEDAAALARYASTLDPQRAAIRSEATRLEGAAR